MKRFIHAFTFIFFFSYVINLGAQESSMQIYNTSGDMIENGSSMASVANSSSTKLLYTDSLLVKNISETSIKVKVRRTDHIVVSGSFSVFTALAQNMGADETITSNFWELDPGATLPTEAFFKGTYYPQSVIGTSNIIYSFLSVDENDQVLDSVFVCYSFSNTSVTPMSEEGDLLYHKEVLIHSDPTVVSEYPILLHNHTIEAVSIRVGKTVLENEEGHEFYFNFGGTEYTPDDNFSDASGVSIAVDQTLEGANGFIAKFNANGVDGNEFLSKVRYKFFNRVAGNDADFVTLVYNPSGVGFSELEKYNISEPYPNPATDMISIDHDLQSTDNAQIKLYNAAGQLVVIHPVMSGSSKSIINTSDLEHGVYFMSFEINNKPIGSEKLIIQ